MTDFVQKNISEHSIQPH